MKIKTTKNTFWLTGRPGIWYAYNLVLGASCYLFDSGFGPLGTSCAETLYCRSETFLLLLCLGWNPVLNCCVLDGCKRSRLAADDDWALGNIENSVGWSKRVTIKRSPRNSNTASDFVELSQSAALLALAIDIELVNNQ